MGLAKLSAHLLFPSQISLPAAPSFVKTTLDIVANASTLLKTPRQPREMALSRLPKLHFSIFTHPLPSPYTHINLPLITKLKLSTLSRLKSTVTTTEPIPFTEAHNLLALQEQTQTQFSLDKLFIPPDTEVSVNENSSGLSARVLKGSNIVLSKYARDAQIVQAEFIKSSVRTEDCPSDGLPEFALVGRSNVGKSSLLNSIVRRKKLALTSKKPG